MKKPNRKKRTTSKDKQSKTLSNFGNRLRQLRKDAGYTSQLTFSYENGFNPPQYNKWERGEDIKLSNIARICDALNISIKEFFSDGFE